MTTTITLSPEQSLRIGEFVAEGSFASTDEAVRFILAEALGEAPLYSAEELAELQQGCDEAARGEFVSQEETAAFFEDWRRNG